MKHSIQAALTDYWMQIDEYMQDAVEKACKPENIRLVVDKAAATAINLVIREETERFFRHGEPGRKAIREAVARQLAQGDEQ